MVSDIWNGVLFFLEGSNEEWLEISLGGMIKGSSVSRDGSVKISVVI